MAFSSLFTNPHRVREANDEAEQRKLIDTLLSYRSKETLGLIASVWGVILVMVFSAVLVYGVAVKLPGYMLYGCW